MLTDGLYLESVGHLGVATATNESEWEHMRQEVANFRATDPLSIDLTNEIAIYLGMAGSSSCPESFAGLVVDQDASRVYGQWQSAPIGEGQGCTDDLQPQGVLLAVSRAELPGDQFTLTLREVLVCADCSDHPDQIVVDLAG
jgi:hypothetical protein